MEQEDKINLLLKKRMDPPAPASDLADRIIHAAIRTPRPERTHWWDAIANYINSPASYGVAIACAILFFVTTIYSPNIPAEENILTDYEFTMVLDVYDEGQSL